MAVRERAGVWFREEKRTRRPRLTRERIIEGAVALLDADGVDGLSMRRLAARVGAGTMSLYEYVASKEDVLDLALDAVMAEIEPAEVPDADAGWRAALAVQATRTREVMRRHPWMVVLLGTRPLLGPNFLLRSERFYAILVRAGLDGRPLIAAVNAVFSYVHGFVAAENAWRGWVRGPGDEAELRRRRFGEVVRVEVEAGMDRALREFRIRGVKTNIPFVLRVLQDPAFRAGQLSTDMVGRLQAALQGMPAS